MGVVSPGPAYIKTQIDAGRQQIGRNVTVSVPGTAQCTQCTVSGFFDPLLQNSWFTTCPECHGAYYLPTFNQTTVLARIHWTDREAITASPGGKYFLGDATLHVDPSYQALMEQAQEGGTILVDGQVMTISRINPNGAPTINRLRIVLKATGDRPT